MAKTAFATSNPLTKKAWEEKLFRDVLKEAYFSRFMGKNADSVVHVSEELEKSHGDEITFGLRMRLTQAGVTDDTELEGNEEALTSYHYKLTLHLYRHATRDAGAIHRKRAMFEIDEEAQAALKDWGSEKIDELCFTALTTSPTKIFFGGTATATNNITANDIITPALISKVKAWAKTGGGRSYVPLRPVKVDGKPYYILIVHPDVLFDLSQNSAWSQAAREALPRGINNPIFSGAEYLWDGVLIHSHENIPIVTNWGASSNVAGAKCVFMGAQAVCFAWGKRPWVVAKDFDYDNEHGYAYNMICAAGKPQFNSKDYGSIGVYVARTPIS